jgi:hypothetical protein
MTVQVALTDRIQDKVCFDTSYLRAVPHLAACITPAGMHIEYALELSVADLGPFIDDVAPPSQKTLWFGILYLFPTVGIAVGYIFGGVIGASMGWRMPFLIQVSLMLSLLYLQDLLCWLRCMDHAVPEHLLLHPSWLGSLNTSVSHLCQECQCLHACMQVL